MVLEGVEGYCKKRDREMGGAGESRVVAQLLTLLDGSSGKIVGRKGGEKGEKGEKGEGEALPIIIFATTMSPNLLDPALRRPGRLEREIVISSPNIDIRFKILRAVTKGVPLEGEEGGGGGGVVEESGGRDEWICGEGFGGVVSGGLYGGFEGA